MEEKKKQYDSLKYYIDIHRDSVGKSGTFITINQLDYARVLFVIGLDYTGWEANYQLALSLHQMIENDYPGLSRGIMKKTGMNVNGVYNQDFSSNCILIEVGGVSNNIDEVYNTMNALANIISKPQHSRCPQKDDQQRGSRRNLPRRHLPPTRRHPGHGERQRKPSHSRRHEKPSTMQPDHRTNLPPM